MGRAIFANNVQDIIIPSEEEHVEMFPLDFEEFLWAMGDVATSTLICQCFENKSPLGQSLHRKVMNDFRKYVLVGGMPQAVVGFLKDKNFEKSDIIKRRILNLYREDLAKFAAGTTPSLVTLLPPVPPGPS